MDVIHAAIWVSDLEDAQSYFVDALGLEVTRTFTLNGIENVFVGGEHGDIQLRYAPDHETPRPDRSAFDHVAVGVDDTDEVFERVVEQTGCAVIKEPTTVDDEDVRIAFIEGPDGYAIELVESLA